jgi:hypothetical protein
MIVKIEWLIVAHGIPIGLNELLYSLMAHKPDIKPSATLIKSLCSEDVFINLT